jgi:3-oxoacyl-[acyl-carrier protein] reductase
MQIRIDGRVALITGGSKGIGLAVARSLAEAGASVALLARGQEGLDAAAQVLHGEGHQNVRTFRCDVTSAEEIKAAYAAVHSTFGRVDILINNAGTSRTGALDSISDETWQEDLDLKLFAAIRLTRLVWPGMKQRRWGRIINVLNTFAKVPRAGSAPTSVSRAAGLALTKVMAAEGAEDNILVNALLVGLIVSDQWVKKHADTGADTSFADFTRNLAKDVPLGRMGTAEEFANLACFLASERASYITGTAINVDGGRSPVV